MDMRTVRLPVGLLACMFLVTPVFAGFFDTLDSLTRDPLGTVGDTINEATDSVLASPQETMYNALEEEDPSEIIELITDGDVSGDLLKELALVVRDKKTSIRKPGEPHTSGYEVAHYDYWKVNLDTARTGLIYALRKGKFPVNDVTNKRFFMEYIETVLKRCRDKRGTGQEVLSQADVDLIGQLLVYWDKQDAFRLASLIFDARNKELALKAEAIGIARFGLFAKRELGIPIDWEQIANAWPHSQPSLEEWADYVNRVLLEQLISPPVTSDSLRELEVRCRQSVRKDDAHEQGCEALWRDISDSTSYFYAKNLNAELTTHKSDDYKRSDLRSVSLLTKVGMVALVPKLSGQSSTKKSFASYVLGKEYIGELTLGGGMICAFLLEDEVLLDKVLTQLKQNSVSQIPDVVQVYWSEHMHTIASEKTQALMKKALQCAIENKWDFDPDIAFVTAYQWKNRDILQLLLTTRKSIPDEVAKLAKTDTFAKDVLREAILGGKQLDTYDNVKSSDLVMLFANDKEVLVALRSAGTSSDELVFDKPFVFEIGGNIPTGNYYLTSTDVILKSDIRVATGNTVRINLLKGTLDGADIIVAKGGALEIYNGSLFPDASIYHNSANHCEIRNRGILVLDDVIVATNIVNHKEAMLTLQGGTHVGDDDASISRGGPSQWDQVFMTGRSWIFDHKKTIPAASSSTGIENNGSMNIADSAYVCIVNNTGSIKGEGLVTFSLKNETGGNVQLASSVFSLIENRSSLSLNSTSASVWIANMGTMRLQNTIFARIDNLKGASLELESCITGWTKESVGPEFNTKKISYEASSGWVRSSGKLAFMGNDSFLNLTTTLLEGEVLGHAMNDATKTYTGEPIVLSVPQSEVGQVLVKEMLPGKFTARLPNGLFPEEVDSTVTGLKSLVVVEE